MVCEAIADAPETVNRKACPPLTKGDYMDKNIMACAVAVETTQRWDTEPLGPREQTIRMRLATELARCIVRDSRFVLEKPAPNNCYMYRLLAQVLPVEEGD